MSWRKWLGIVTLAMGFMYYSWIITPSLRKAQKWDFLFPKAGHRNSYLSSALELAIKKRSTDVLVWEYILEPHFRRSPSLYLGGSYAAQRPKGTDRLCWVLPLSVHYHWFRPFLSNHVLTWLSMLQLSLCNESSVKTQRTKFRDSLRAEYVEVPWG
jgi:hypothetical protein